jgi:hypothetical protein
MSQQPAYDKIPGHRYLHWDAKKQRSPSLRGDASLLCRQSIHRLRLRVVSSLRPNFRASSRAFQFGEAEEQRDIRRAQVLNLRCEMGLCQ